MRIMLWYTILRNPIKMHANVICKRHLKIEPKTFEHGLLMARTLTHTDQWERYLKKRGKFTDKFYWNSVK